jgi:hypothetical protein
MYDVINLHRRRSEPVAAATTAMAPMDLFEITVRGERYLVIDEVEEIEIENIYGNYLFSAPAGFPRQHVDALLAAWLDGRASGEARGKALGRNERSQEIHAVLAGGTESVPL